jgi:hypothetical protein
MDGHESRRPRSEGGGVPAGSGQTLRLAAAARRRPPGARRRPRRPGTWSLSRVRADGPHTPAPRRAVRAGRRAGGAIGLGRHAGGATVTVQRPTRNLNSRPGNLNFLQANSNLQSAVLESFRVCDRQGDRDSESLAAWAAPDSGESDDSDSEGRFEVARPPAAGPSRGAARWRGGRGFRCQRSDSDSESESDTHCGRLTRTRDSEGPPPPGGGPSGTRHSESGPSDSESSSSGPGPLKSFMSGRIYHCNLLRGDSVDDKSTWSRVTVGPAGGKIFEEPWRWKGGQ